MGGKERGEHGNVAIPLLCSATYDLHIGKPWTRYEEVVAFYLFPEMGNEAHIHTYTYSRTGLEICTFQQLAFVL